MADELNSVSAAAVETGAADAGVAVDTGGQTGSAGEQAAAQPGQVGGEQQAATEPQSELEAYLAEQLKEQEAAKPSEPQAQPPAEQGPLPEAVTAALGVSEFVKEPAHLQAAVQAADEVWRVQTGQLPAWQMIEAVKGYSPERYQAIIGELVPYIEHVTGKKFGGAGAEAGGAETVKDPVAELRAEIAQREQQQQEREQNAAYERRVQAVIPVLKETVAATLTKEFGEGHEAYFLSRIAATAKIDERQMVAELAKGNKAPLEEAIKTVRREELQRFAAYNRALVAQAKALKKGLPATKPATQTPTGGGEATGSAGWTREQSAEYLKTGIAPV